MTFESALDPVRCEEVARMLAALAHPVRLRIVCGLTAGECCVGPMVACLGLPQAQVSHHLAILREAGVIAADRDGRRRIYRIAHPVVSALVTLLRNASTNHGETQ